MEYLHHDVCVIGAGLAGITAALTAAARGARTLLVCDGPCPSGSSFFPGTWGVGVVSALEVPAEREDLIDAIMDNGYAMADRDLVRTLVEDTPEALGWLQDLGVQLKEPTAGRDGERAYIPCFDHRTRQWHGLATAEAAPVLLAALEASSVEVRDHCRLLSLIGRDGEASPDDPTRRGERRVTGLVALHNTDSGALEGPAETEVLLVEARSTIIATGGMAATNGRYLGDSHADGSGAIAALDAGCRLVNVEFMQIMTGFEGPDHPIVFNEKLWGQSRLTLVDGIDAFEAAGVDGNVATAALSAHSIHGPFTASRVSRHVEEVIARATQDDPHGCRLTIQPPEKIDEFTGDYLSWLETQVPGALSAGIPVALYAQASNGGILIDGDGHTDVAGLWAAGEVTGGIHGADRIGGLASAAALVTGRRAGAQAALEARGLQPSPAQGHPRLLSPIASIPEADGFLSFEDICGVLAGAVRDVNDRALLAGRSEQRLQGALSTYETVQRSLASAAGPGTTAFSDPLDVLAFDGEQLRRAASHRDLTTLIWASRARAEAALLRDESRGSHQRVDHPRSSADDEWRIMVSGHSPHPGFPGTLNAYMETPPRA